MTQAQTILRQLSAWGLSDSAIAPILNCRVATINDIRHGKQTGRNITPRLQKMVRLVQENYALL